MSAFDLQTLAADLREMVEIFASFLRDQPASAWRRRTEVGNRGWTLTETLAHLDAVALAYQQAIESALTGRPLPFAGDVQRANLLAWNEREIAARAHLPIAAIGESFLNTLRQAEACASNLSPAELACTTPFPFYNRPITIAQLLVARPLIPAWCMGHRSPTLPVLLPSGCNLHPPCASASLPASLT
jgi:hypothetical protein